MVSTPKDGAKEKGAAASKGAPRGAKAIAQANTPAKPTLPTIQTWIPRAHLHILNEEAKFMGLHRSQLLRHLLYRKLGRQPLERSPEAPKYNKFTLKDLEQMERYTWSITPDDKALVDRDRMAMGNLNYTSWIVIILNHWIGKPDGLL